MAFVQIGGAIFLLLSAQLSILESAMVSMLFKPFLKLLTLNPLISYSGRVEQLPGRLPEITAGIEKFLWECVEQSPRDFGLHRPSWTTALLAKLVKRQFKVEVTPECIRQHLGRIDIVCRRSTWTVKHKARKKIGYAQKKGFNTAFATTANGCRYLCARR